MKARIIEFINWMGCEEWQPSSFFKKLHSWFSGDDTEYSMTEYLFISTKYLLTETQAQVFAISNIAQELWNQIILFTTRVDSTYNIQDRAQLSAMLEILKNELENAINTTPPQYAIKSNFVPYTGPFIEREDYFGQIHSWLMTSKSVLFLYGMAGIGKSVLAKVYAARYRDFYDTILFSTYEISLLETVINDDMVPVQGLHFQRNGKRGEKGRYFRKKIELLKRLMNSHTLWIIDNFDVLQDPYLPIILSLPCKIIFTTRTMPQVFGLRGISVTAISDKETLRKLFFLYAPGLSLNAQELVKLDKLISTVHGHTLALKIIASHMATASNLLDKWSLNSADMKEQFYLILQMTNLNKQERTVLRYLAVMPYTGITLDRFEEYCHFNKMSVVDDLIHKNIIEHEPSKKMIFLHPLVAQIIREQEQPDFANCWPYASTLCDLGRRTWWNTSEEMDQYRKYIYAFMEYVQQPEKRYMDEIIYLVDGCWQLGNFTLAEKYGKLLHAYCCEHFGAEHLMTARVRHSIGTIYYNWGKNHKAAYWYRMGYEGYKDVPEPDVYFYGILLMKVGRAMRYEKKWEEAEKYLKKSISFLQEHLDVSSKMSIQNSQNKGWLVLLFDIYSEYILFLLDQKKADEAWCWCVEYFKQYEKYQFKHESMLWKPYYAMGLAKAQMNDQGQAEYYLRLGLENADIYHSKHAVIHLMILEALKQIPMDISKKKNVYSQIREWKKPYKNES